MKKLGIIFATVIIMLLFTFSANASAVETFWSDNGNFDASWYYKNTNAKEYTINSASEIAGLAFLVNNGNTFENKIIKLTADIDLGDHIWTPIGIFDSAPFAGSFDGQGHTISNMKAKGDYSSLFSYAISGAEIVDIDLRDVYLSDGNYISGVVSYLYADGEEILIKNCIVSGKIFDDSANSDDDYSTCTAGIISYVKTGGGKISIKNCINYARIICDKYGAGIIGYIESNNTDSNKNVIINNCYNYGGVYGGDNAYSCGGIVGYATYAKFEQCANFADVLGEPYSDDDGAAFFGGICGEGVRTDFFDCANYGKISSFYVGGITHGSINKVINCISVGELTFASYPDSWGYVLSDPSGTYDNCYYLYGIIDSRNNYSYANNYPRGVLDVSSSGFSSGEVCYLLNNSTSKGDVIWGQNIDNGEPIQDYPVIGSAKVYFIDGKYTNAPEHNFDEGNVIVESTCIENGVAVYTCLDCDYKFTEVINNHRYESVTTTIQPTHTEEGVKTYKCSCGNVYTESIEKLEGHTYKSVVTKEPTHTEEGITTYTCACGDTYTKPIEKTTKHTFSSVVTPPTCTERGFTTYTCECGYSSKNNYINTIPHTYTSSITTPATHLTKGVKTFTCACGDSYTESIPKLEGHTYTSQIAIQPTHLAEGEETFTCACGDSYTKPIAKISEHNYTVLNIVEPTCENDGYTTFLCECGQTYNGDKKAATGHNYDGDYCVNCGESKVDNCSCNCHKGGFMGFIWKIINFFNKLFKTNKTCSCGVSHY